jgi:hypothetical protein
MAHFCPRDAAMDGSQTFARRFPSFWQINSWAHVTMKQLHTYAVLHRLEYLAFGTVCDLNSVVQIITFKTASS